MKPIRFLYPLLMVSLILLSLLAMPVAQAFAKAGDSSELAMLGMERMDYTQDYLGNNRAVVNGSTGAIEQTTAYYPYGGVIADLGSGNTGQPFKFGGKELVTANGLIVFIKKEAILVGNIN